VESGLGVLSRALRSLPVGRVTESAGVAALERFMMRTALPRAVSGFWLLLLGQVQHV